MPFLPRRSNVSPNGLICDWFLVTNELAAARQVTLSNNPTDDRTVWFKIPGCVDQWSGVDFSVEERIIRWTLESDIVTLLASCIGQEVCLMYV